MVSNRLLHTSSMLQMLGQAISFFSDQGVICEVTSPSSMSFKSTLPKERVKEIFEASSIPIKPTFEETPEGCMGTVIVQGVTRADE